MAFVKDLGQCCLVLPLKLGIGLIAMAVFANACLCVLALVSTDIRFQPNGYDQNFMFVPSGVGACGLVLGFVGLLGVYDDKPGWVRVFFLFLVAKLAAMSIAMVADYVKLWQCDSWLRNHSLGDNVAIEVLASSGVCPWARWAYLIGSGLDLSFWVYCTVKVWSFKSQIEYDNTYPIDFGREKYDIEARWRLFQVKDPTPEINRMLDRRKQYQARLQQQMDDAQANAVGLPTNYGSITEVDSTTYGPDGMPADAQR